MSSWDPLDPANQLHIKQLHGITDEGMRAANLTSISNHIELSIAQRVTRERSEQRLQEELEGIRIQVKADAIRDGRRAPGLLDAGSLGTPPKRTSAWIRALAALAVSGLLLVPALLVVLVVFWADVHEFSLKVTGATWDVTHYQAIDPEASRLASRPGEIVLSEQTIGALRPWFDYTPEQQRLVAASWIEFLAGDSQISRRSPDDVRFSLSAFEAFLEHRASEGDTAAAADLRYLRVLALPRRAAELFDSDVW